MAWELEGLISHLLILISCAGEEGCAVSDIVNEIRGLAGFSGPRTRGPGEPLSAQAVATIWGWLVARRDVSVGPNRKHNERPVHEVLALIRKASGGGSDSGETSGQSQGPTYPELASSNASSLQACPLERIYVSEDTMWETITGHSVNYKRVPRSEWLLLLGIASTKDQGILQGDLGRLVDQDKRSVPKRTDSLVKKGYIVKRTTLVKGTKTSKLWLKLFAPPLPKETDDQAIEREAEMNLSRHTLAANLEPVPWHTRWTGESMDFHALATTIMATTKEWQVIRLQDLKAKLGVLGMRWQMKIVSKICRFLNSRGAIQYVAAKLDNKLFKDCIRFNKDLTAKDWAAFLATGKRATKPMKTALFGMTDRAERDGHADATRVNGSRLEKIPPWSIDTPLPQKITKAAESFGTVGLTNPEIYALTLGPTFNRYVSSMTTSMATSTVQPLCLQHMQLKSEHIRVGKVASYRYYLPQLPSTREFDPTANARQDQSTSTCMHWFEAPSSKPRFSSLDTTISNMCGLVKTHGPTSGEPKRRGRPKKVGLGDASEQSELVNPTTRAHSEPTIESEGAVTYQNSNRFVTLHISSKALRTVLGQESTSQNDQNSTPHTAESPALTMEVDKLMHNTLDQTGPDTTPSHNGRRGRGRGRGSARGRGRGRPPHTTSVESSSSRPWTCETCGGSWKNDIGLKYHLEKSRTPCNPQYTPGAQGLSRRGRKAAFFVSKSRDPSNESCTHASPELSPSIRDLAEVDEDSCGRDSVVDQTLIVASHATNQFQWTDTPSQRSRSSHVAKVKSWKRSSAALDQTIKFTAPKTDQGLLLHPSANPPRQVPILQNPKRHTKISTELIVPGASKELFSITNPSLSAATGAVPQAKQPPVVGISDTSDTAGSSGAPSANYRPCYLLASNGSIARTKFKAGGARVKNDEAKIGHYIERLLRDQNGVLLGGKLLWDHVLATWNSEYPEEPAPKRDECQSALNRLLKEGIVVEHWHMFRDSSRSFSKCQLLTLPGVDAFSPESLQLLDKVRDVQAVQESGGHNKLTEDTQCPENKAGGRSRRLLAREVAVLHAPVYAAQIAAKKGQGAAETRERAKRRRLSDSRRDMEATGLYVPRKRKRVRWALANGESGSPSELPDLSLLQPNMASEMTVQFLQPNTFLEQDASNSWSPVYVRSEKHQPGSKENVTEKVPNDNPQTRELFSPLTTLTSQNGAWACLDPQYFEQVGGSFSIKGWMPSSEWFEWASFIRAVDKRHAFLGSTKGFTDKNDTSRCQNFMRRVQALLEVEMSWKALFEESAPGSAGPHNIWIDFCGEPSSLDPVSSHYELTWPEDGQPAQTSQYNVSLGAGYALSSSSDEELDVPKKSSNVKNARVHSAEARQSENITFKAKRLALATRALTPLSVSQHDTVSKDEGEPEDYPFDGTDDLMAAFIAVRTLMGGADKAIDWGLLMLIFPNAKLTHLRRFWVDARKERGPFIANFTRAFQERFITALDQNEIPTIDFDEPQNYDWAKLIRWTLQISREEGFQIPSSRELFNGRFSLESTKTSGEDWRERFFHTQSSIFSRFEAVTAVPGVFALDGGASASKDSPRSKEMEIARSWIKSLCSMGDGKYTVEEIRDKFFTLSPGNDHKTSALFKEVIELLTKQKIICKSKKPLLGGRPYRLNEGYVAALNKMAQKSKYDEAAAFKTKMDNMFRKQGKMRIPYTLSDGAMMALTNLNASGRINLISTNLPYIPLGFEPGNYESRKYPKSYYHFGLEAIPAEIYQYNEQVDVLRVACEKGPPAGDPSKELPQWVDFFGQPNKQRWSEILGAFCFSLATRGSMDTDGIRAALNPILDEFEVQLIVRWGKETGVLTDFSDGVGLVVGEWWWLTVPWLRQI